MPMRLVTFTESGKSVTYRYSDKQLAFIEAYLDTFNGTGAARRAGYKGNDNVLSTVAWENLRKPKIARLIKQRMAVECMTATENLKHLAQIARGVDIAKYIIEQTVEGDNEKSYTIHSFDMDALRKDGLGRLVKSITPARGGGLRIEFIDRLGALNSIAKHHALFTDVIITAQVDAADKGLLDDDDRKKFAQDILGRIDRRSE